ncbi:MAG: carboxypeptidase-like regulatory domain-containing protein, partial [Bacteroidota bacterium]
MKFLYSGVLYFLVFTCSAQISGLVTDKQGQPLTGANLYIKGTYDGTSSNTDGRFSLKTDLKGEIQLICEFIGFQSDSLLINLN